MKSKKLSKFIAGVMSVVMTFCCVFVPAFAADCDHMGNNFIYRDNGNGTHNVVCNDCGEAVAEGVACTWEGDHACICGSVKPACDHMGNHFSYSDNGNGTHDVICDDCGEAVSEGVHCFWDKGNSCVCGSECDHMDNHFSYKNNGNGTHDVVCDDCNGTISANVQCVWEEGTACICGSVEPVCDHMGNHFSYSDNGNGTHDVVCDDCNETISANVQCVWEEGTACICGSVEPVCDHMGNHFSYSDNGNGTHDVICDDCNETISANVQCVWEGDHSCVCGSEKPVIIPRELKTVIVKFLEDKDSAQEEVAASIVVNKDDWALMQGSVYSKFEREGYKLSGWRIGDRFFKAGQKVTFEELAEIIGDNFDAEGNSILSFYPVFDKINNPDNSGSGDSGNSTAGRANVNTGVL